MSIPPLHQQGRNNTIRFKSSFINILNHSNVDGERKPLVKFEKEFSSSPLSYCISVCTYWIFTLYNDATGSWIVIEVIRYNIFDPIIEFWIEIFFVIGDLDKVFIGFLFIEFIWCPEFLITCSKI